MKKVICGICGTMYPETESKCPLCGGVRRPEDAIVTVEETEEETAAAPMPKKRSNNGMLITILVLLLAIIAVSAYIAIRFLGVLSTDDTTKETKPAPTTPPTAVATQPETVPCTSLVLGNNAVKLNGIGAAWQLDVKVEPENTTDPVVFASSDPAIASVTEQGEITAVAEGQAVITVTCGSVTQECTVVCSVPVEEPTVPDETTEPTTPETQPDETDEPDVELSLNRSDITFSEKDETFRFSVGSLSPVQVTWSSDNSSVASIDNGRVTAVGSGTTKIHATYKGQTVSCIIRCDFEDDTPSQSETGRGVHLTHEDVSIVPGESFTIKLMTGDSNRIDASFSTSDSSVCSVSGGTVTGVGSGTAYVTTTHEGKTYSCIIRVG